MMFKSAHPLFLAALLPALAGCHSAFVQATVRNDTAQRVQIFEVDYPSASFGAGDLAPGAIFHYRFKILGSGPVKITWTDASDHDHTASGPELSEGQEGSLAVTLSPRGANWSTSLHAAK